MALICNGAVNHCASVDCISARIHAADEITHASAKRESERRHLLALETVALGPIPRLLKFAVQLPGYLFDALVEGDVDKAGDVAWQFD